MKIVIFLENNRAGGLDTFCVNLIQSWPNKTDEFLLLCNHSHPGLKYIEKLEFNNLKIITHSIPLSWDINLINSIKNNNIKKIIRNIFRLLIMPYQYIRVKSLLKNINSKYLISLNGAYPGGNTTRMANIAWKKLKKGRSIHAVHGHADKNNNKIKMMVEKFINLKLFNSTDDIVTVSNSCAESLRDIPGYSNSIKTNVIYNGIDCMASKNIAAIKLKDYVKLPENSPILLMLGTYSSNKGHSFLFKVMLEVIKEYPECHLVICGDGIESEKTIVKKLLADMTSINKNIHLLDFIQGASAFMPQTDIVLIGSQENESFGLTAIEAMNNMVPVISTDVGGLKEVIEDSEVGYCCNKDNPKLFAERIVYLLKNPKIRKKMGIKGQERVKNYFDSKKMSMKYYSLLIK